LDEVDESETGSAKSLVRPRKGPFFPDPDGAAAATGKTGTNSIRVIGGDSLDTQAERLEPFDLGNYPGTGLYWRDRLVRLDQQVRRELVTEAVTYAMRPA
jgi:hypothetical protein